MSSGTRSSSPGPHRKSIWGNRLSRASYPLITQELLNRGYSEKDIHKILGENIIRALGAAEKVAARAK